MTADVRAASAAAVRLSRPRPVRSSGPMRFVADMLTVAGRATRQLRRELAFVIPALIIPIFFYGVNVGSLEGIAAAAAPGFDVRAFQLPVAIIFAVTGVSRANALVQDISGGYFERLLLTPVNRLALLLGLMAADFVLIVALSIPVILMGWITGVSFVTGIGGILAFILMAAMWGIAFNGFPYAIALKTGNPSAVGASFILFFPFAFLTTAYCPGAGPVRLARDGRPVQPGDVPARGAPLADHGGLGRTGDRRRAAGDRSRGRRVPDAGPDRAAGARGERLGRVVRPVRPASPLLSRPCEPSTPPRTATWPPRPRRST